LQLVPYMEGCRFRHGVFHHRRLAPGILTLLGTRNADNSSPTSAANESTSWQKSTRAWSNRQTTWQNTQMRACSTLRRSTLDQKVPGSTPGGAIASAAVTYT
jgi:hypothetical protein